MKTAKTLLRIFGPGVILVGAPVSIFGYWQALSAAPQSQDYFYLAGGASGTAVACNMQSPLTKEVMLGGADFREECLPYWLADPSQLAGMTVRFDGKNVALED